MGARLAHAFRRLKERVLRHFLVVLQPLQIGPLAIQRRHLLTQIGHQPR